MIFKNIDDNEVITALMSKVEADVLKRALTIAKLEVGDDVVLGRDGMCNGVDIEHLRTVLSIMSAK